jgi:hypothetical protein
MIFAKEAHAKAIDKAVFPGTQGGPLMHIIAAKAVALREAPRLITGDDLIAKGYCPGPTFSRMLSVIEDAQLEGRIRSREEAFALVQDVFGKPNPQAERSVE